MPRRRCDVEGELALLGGFLLIMGVLQAVTFILIRRKRLLSDELAATRRELVELAGLRADRCWYCDPLVQALIGGQINELLGGKPDHCPMGNPDCARFRLPPALCDDDEIDLRVISPN